MKIFMLFERTFAARAVESPPRLILNVCRLAPDMQTMPDPVRHYFIDVVAADSDRTASSRCRLNDDDVYYDAVLHDMSCGFSYLRQIYLRDARFRGLVSILCIFDAADLFFFFRLRHTDDAAVDV